MPIHLPIDYGCFHATTAELSSCNRLSGIQSGKNIYYLALSWKSLQICGPKLCLKLLPMGQIGLGLLKNEGKRKGTRG